MGRKIVWGYEGRGYQTGRERSADSLEYRKILGEVVKVQRDILAFPADMHEAVALLDHSLAKKPAIAQNCCHNIKCSSGAWIYNTVLSFTDSV